MVKNYLRRIGVFPLNKLRTAGNFFEIQLLVELKIRKKI